ncbi:hypothetical protein CEXT_723851 [Caerostris extrusa]|uniref:Secreted protein n=1 Tax=Caerostris extrusa TaxID=172846 RepID=A0AAV4M5I1_CAEEX|nr:hypothetical protein CEXT_723851 [Caerostris extrusa]
MLQSVGFCEKSIAVATRDVKSASVSPCTLLCLWRIGEGDGAEFVPSCKCWPFPFEMLQSVSFFVRKSIAVATRDVKSASVSHALLCLWR